MSTEMEYPKLREIEAFPVAGRGQSMIGLRDAARLTDKVVMVPQNVFFLLSLFDGKHSLREIQVAYTRRYGDLLFTDKLKEIIGQLDENLLLESERFEKFRQQLEEEFKASKVRRATHAGTAYENDPERLGQQMEQIMAAGEEVEAAETGDLKALVAPHIDFARGAACYGAAYRQLNPPEPPDLFIILGTAHAETAPFVLTAKDFETPFGIVETDKAFVDALQQHCQQDLMKDEFAHRGEHSIEFQVVCLHYLSRNSKPPRIVPILCGSFHHKNGGLVDPGQDEQVVEFLEALKELIAQAPGRTCVIAGADLSHVGGRFGDQGPLTPGLLGSIREQDEKMLERVAEMDADGFFKSIRDDNDRRRICGFPPIYALLRVVEAGRGELLKYDQAIEQQMQSVVSFASMVFS